MPEFVDLYVDPDTGILRNLLGARTQSALDRAEADVSQALRLTLGAQTIAPTGDLAELRAIHRHLFQDVYAWAGEIRTVDIAKRVEGAEHFLPMSRIQQAAGFAATELSEDDQMRDLGPLVEMFERIVIRR